jgi:hypothetical protein
MGDRLKEVNYKEEKVPDYIPPETLSATTYAPASTT